MCAPRSWKSWGSRIGRCRSSRTISSRGIYDHDDFLETLKRFILSRGFARVRVLVVDPTRVITTASRFVNMGRRLNSYIEFRNVKQPSTRPHPEAFCIADEHALMYRRRHDRWEGMSDTYEPAVARST